MNPNFAGESQTTPGERGRRRRGRACAWARRILERTGKATSKLGPYVFAACLVPFAVAASVATAADTSRAELGKPDLQSAEFAKRFTASYGVLSAREPQISDLELAVLEKLAPMITESPARAQSALESMLADGKPVSAAFNHVLGNLYFGQRDWGRAEAQYREAIRKFPDFQRAWNSLGSLKMETDDYHAAAEALARSIELGANDAQTYGMLGYALLQSREYAAAEVAYNLALLRDPSGVRWLEGRARILAESGRHAETLAATDELLRHDPQNFEYWRLQANAHLGLNHTMETARSLEIARTLGPLDGNALFLLGGIYLREGMADHALDAYLAAIKLEPKTAPAMLLRVANSLLGQEQFDLGRRLLATLTPDDAWTPRDRVLREMLNARVALHDGNVEAATAAFERALELDPINAECLYRVAVLYAEHGQAAKARYYLDKIKNDPNYEYGAQLYLAKMLVGENRYTEAMTCLRNAYRLKPGPEVEDLYNRVRVASESHG
jgi:tetratricopeptide (TPR) repeat protein